MTWDPALHGMRMRQLLLLPRMLQLLVQVPAYRWHSRWQPDSRIKRNHYSRHRCSRRPGSPSKSSGPCKWTSSDCCVWPYRIRRRLLGAAAARVVGAAAGVARTGDAASGVAAHRGAEAVAIRVPVHTAHCDVPEPGRGRGGVVLYRVPAVAPGRQDDLVADLDVVDASSDALAHVRFTGGVRRRPLCRAAHHHHLCPGAHPRQRHVSDALGPAAGRAATVRVAFNLALCHGDVAADAAGARIDTRGLTMTSGRILGPRNRMDVVLVRPKRTTVLILKRDPMIRKGAPMVTKRMQMIPPSKRWTK